MTTLIPLLATFLSLSLCTWACRRPVDPVVRARIAAAVMFVSTGAMHFAKPAGFAEMVPPFFPAPELIVAATGYFEIALGLGFLFAATRRWAGYASAAFLLAVLPANIYAAMNSVGVGGHLDGPGYLWIRIPVQLFLIGWVLWAGLTPQRGAGGSEAPRAAPMQPCPQ